MIVSLLFTLGLVLLLSWLPGYGLARLLRAFDGDEAAVAAWPLSWGILGGLQFAGFVLGLPPWWRFVLWAVCGGLIIYALTSLRRHALSAAMKQVLLLGLGAVAATACIAIVSPAYDGIAGWYGDWWMHYDISQYYLGLRADDVVYFGVYTIPSRFPLFNLVQAALLALLGNHFWVYQIAGVVPLGGLIGATYLLARNWMGKRVAILAAGLLVMNPFVIQNALTPWPKVMAAGCLLLGLAMYMRRGAAGLRWWAVFTGLALMVHQAATFVAVAVVLHALLRYRRSAVTPLIHAATIAALICAPWLLWAISRFGLTAMLTATPTISAMGAAIGSAGWLIERAWNAVGTLVPLSFLRAASEWARAGFRGEQMPALFGAILRYSYDVLPGAVTTVLSLVLLAHFWPGRKPPTRIARATETHTPASRSAKLLAAVRSDTGLAVMVSLFAFAGAIMVQPGQNRSGLAAESLAPVVVLLVIIAARAIVEAPARWRSVVAVLAMLEFALTRGLHTLAVLVGIIPTSGDPNLTLKLDNGVTFIADMMTWEKGLPLLAMTLIWLALGRWLLQYVRASCSKSDATEHNERHP